MKKIKYFMLGVVATFSIACNSDDNNSKIEEIEKITVTEVDTTILLQQEWIKSKSTYINSDFKFLKEIEAPSCSLDRIFFDNKKVEILNHFFTNECVATQYDLDYKIRGNEVFTLFEDYHLFYTVMTLNDSRLVLLQEVDPTNKNTPAGAKYIKLEYFKYKKSNN